METETVTLTEFLLARCAEDEARALRWRDEWGKNGGVIDLTITPGPTRVLAECEAKRRIVAEHKWRKWYEEDDSGNLYCWTCCDDRCYDGDPKAHHAPHPPCCRTLTLLALPYAGHAGYRSEWTP